MSLVGKSADTRYLLNNKIGDGPIELNDITVLATFDNDNVQANITTSQFTFTGDEALALLDQIAKGLTGGVGMYEMPKYEIQAYNNENTITAFDGYLDLPALEDLTDSEPKVRTRLVKRKGLNRINKRLEGLTYGRLEQEGILKNSDYHTLEYVVEPKIQALEVMIMGVTLFMMTKTLVEQIKSTSKTITDAIAHATGGVPTGPAAAAIWTAVVIVLEIAYSVAITIAIADLMSQMIKLFVPPVREAKIASYRTLLEKPFNKLGYKFESPITDLDELYNLASNEQIDDVDPFTGLFTKLKGPTSGIPRPSDEGYICSEFFNRCKSLFKAEIALVGDTVHFRTLKDPWWVKNSTYKRPSSIVPVKKRNHEDLKESTLIQFATDITDDYTIDNFKGTNYEITVEPIIINDPEAVAISGFDRDKNYNISLGSRKDELNAVENILLDLANFTDGVINTFGGNSNLAASISNKVGVLKISQNNYALPKILRVVNGKMPSNHRATCSAKYFYDEYIDYDSFVRNNFGGQRTIYEGGRTGFGLNDFMALINNSYFTNFDGKVGKYIKLEWNMSGDYVDEEFYIQEPHSKNLQETYIEVENG